MDTIYDQYGCVRILVSVIVECGYLKPLEKVELNFVHIITFCMLNLAWEQSMIYFHMCVKYSNIYFSNTPSINNKPLLRFW